MKQLTIRGVGNDLHKALKVEANRRSMSINRAVVSILQEALGISNGTRQTEITFDDLDYLAGTWTSEEAEEFERQLAAQRSIDEELWQ